jgi:protein TonB
VKTAREGRLVIMERDLPERSVWLEPERLKIGFVSFQPTTGHIEFRLEIVDRSGQTFQESVLALASAPAPAAPAPQELPAPAPPPSVETKPQVPQVAKIQEAPQPTRAPIRTFVMPPPKPLSPDQARAVLLDSPAVAANPGLPETGDNLAATRLSSTPVKAPPAPPPPPKRIKVGGNLQAANLIRKVAPVYPPVAKATRIQGTVRFTATIGKDGTIHSLQALSGPALLVQSATEAVKQWVYRPMLLNGDPVEVETQIDVTFTLGN